MEKQGVITELKQRKLFHHKHLALYNNRLYYKNKGPFSSFELDIPFEELTNHVIYQKTSKPILWLFTAIFFIVFLTKSFYMFIEPDFEFGVYFTVIALMIIFGTGAWYAQQDVMLIKASQPTYIELYTKRPKEQTVNEFYIELRKTSKDYLLNKFVYDSSFPLAQQKVNLDQLQELRIIDEVDFKIISNKLDGKQQVNPVGFKIPS